MILGVFFCTFTLHAQLAYAKDDLTKVERSDGCVAYFPDHYDMSLKWSGACKDGLAEGKVVFSAYNRPTVVNFSGGYVEGEIKMVGDNGYLYACNYVRSVPNGYCTSKRGTRENYISKYVDGTEQEGSGFKEFIIGDGESSKQEGRFYGGQLNGFGKLSISAKSKSIAQFEKRVNKSWRLEGANLVSEGLWVNGYLQIACSNKRECEDIKRSKDALGALNLAKNQQCEAQKQTCFASCGSASYWNGRSYVENQSWSGCRSNCSVINCS